MREITEPFHIVQCQRERHGEAILSIFNEAILHSTALYEYHPRTLEFMDGWFDAKARGNFPIIGIEDADGDLMGFASYGTFRAWPAYKYSVEHSVYVDARHRRKGVGRILLEQLIDAAVRHGYHTLIGGIDASNAPSITLHERLDFVHCGTIRQAGFKFGRWLDLAFYQRILPSPECPVDG